MHAMLSGIARGDVRAAPAVFEDVDRAKQATEAAVESGRYIPARNGNQLARFRELDEAFHGDLEKMLEVAARNDIPGTAEAFGSTVRRCQSCHAEFRK
jgi:cytochrome c556